MKLVLLTMATTSERWSESASELYFKKIKAFYNFELQQVAPPRAARSDSQLRRESDSKKILEKLSQEDFVVLLDERGKALGSRDFAKKIELAINSGKKRVVFVIGGPYGASDDLRSRANWVASLGSLTFNHLIAEVVFLEQLYRSLTIIKNIPYHND